MSHYRKLIIDDVDYQYQYNIGKKFVDIRPFIGDSLMVEKSEIGFKSRYGGVIIHPKMIVDYILGKKKQHVSTYFPTCPCKNVPKELGVRPYEHEIDGKDEYVYWCENCYDLNADDI